MDFYLDDIPADEHDMEDKKISPDFIEDILSTDIKLKPNLSCTLCNLSFESEDTFDLHMQTSHSNTSDESPASSDVNKSITKSLFECPDCHKVFAENKILKRHLKIHSPIKPHACTECDMSFAESSNLSKHMKKHTGELRNVVGKPNLCSVCGKGFKWASSLSKHMKHHTRHKILTCPYCPKYYVEARSLNIHMRSHTGEKPFICEVCKKGFTQMGNLEKHIRVRSRFLKKTKLHRSFELHKTVLNFNQVHTGEKPFTCPICNKGFSQSGYVAIHLR